MALTNEDKQRLKQQYGDLIYAKYPEGEFLFRTPTEMVFSQFLSASASDKKGTNRLVAFQQMCVGCLVYPETRPGEPDYGALQSLFQRLPGLPLNIGGELADLAGAGDTPSVGKL